MKSLYKHQEIYGGPGAVTDWLQDNPGVTVISITQEDEVNFVVFYKIAVEDRDGLRKSSDDPTEEKGDIHYHYHYTPPPQWCPPYGPPYNVGDTPWTTTVVSRSTTTTSL